MDSKPSHGMDAEEAVSPDKSPRLSEQNDPTSTSTNSMVTVRLSDTTFDPNVDSSTYEPSIEGLNSIDLPRNKDNIVLSRDDEIEIDTKHGDTVLEDTMREMPRARPESTVSATSIGEGKRLNSTPAASRSRSNSSSTLSSIDSAQVDWDELDKSEEQAPRDEGSDESTAFLLARLEQENNALATDPKAAVARPSRSRTKSRPPSIQHLKKLVNEPTKPSLRYSMVPNPPPMTELEFWAALVANYSQTAYRLPTLTSKKIRSGIPPPLRGVVWLSITGARDQFLEEEYDRLCGESSPYENLIGKDIGRSFPSVEMFRDPSGEGQRMLGRVLKSFSLYDNKIGYCQGLGFVVGPLLMHMGDKEAFCVLVRLMEHYDLRSCFLPDLSGLHLRIYQFQYLLSQHLPSLATHLESLQVEPLYVSQWFLSFFGVTCPLPMLLRIYDVILTEGASETLMRVALSLMRRNESKILKCAEFEDVMQLLLSRSLWDTYVCNADDLVNDFVGLTGLVTREGLESLETKFKDAPHEDLAVKITSEPNVQAAASSFLGRLWSGSHSSNKTISSNSSLGVTGSSRPSSFLRRTPSKQSMASTLNSIESIESHISTTSTDATAMSSGSSAEHVPLKSSHVYNNSVTPTLGDTSKDKDLHRQIEDLLTALSDMQRDQAALASELQKQREEREEERAFVQTFVKRVTNSRSLEPVLEDQINDTGESPSSPKDSPSLIIDRVLLTELDIRFTIKQSQIPSILQSKSQLHEEVRLWKDRHELEAAKSTNLSRQITDLESENMRLLEQFRGMRSRMQEAHQDKQRLEKQIHEMRSRRSSSSDTYTDDSPVSPDSPGIRTGGLREFKLGRTGSFQSQTPATQSFSKRSSSLGIQAVLATEDHKPPAEDALLLELVTAKTAEAVARQELEEVRGKLDSLRRLLGESSPVSPTVNSGHRPSPSEPCVAKNPNVTISTNVARGVPVKDNTLKVTSTPSSGSSGGGFFSGWGKRTVSTPPTMSVAAPEA